MRRLALAAGTVLGASALTGCYGVPPNEAGQPASVPASASAPAAYAAPALAGTAFPARLYPANAAAEAYGVVGAVVTNDSNGHGTFSTQINGENFSGEAMRLTRVSSHQGAANGTGNRGSYISCRYQMNSATLGTGECQLSSGAQFSMHVGI
jgi:hypothetical protein